MNTTDIKDLQKVLTRIESELDSCYAQIMEIEGRLRVIPVELDRLASRSRSRQATLHTAQSSFNAARSARDKQEILISMAQDTATFAQSLEPLTALEKAVNDAQERLDAITDRACTEQEKDETKEQPLQQEQQELTQKLEALQSRKTALRETKEEVSKRLGKGIYEQCAKQVEQLRADLEEKQNEADRIEQEAKQALDTAISQGLKKLANWSEHQKAFAPDIVAPTYRDAVTETLESFLSFLDTLVRNIEDLRSHAVHVAEWGHSINVLSLVEIHPEQINPYMKRDLEKHGQKLRICLKSYRRERGH